MSAIGRITAAAVTVGMRLNVERYGDRLDSTKRKRQGVEVATVTAVEAVMTTDGRRQQRRYVITTDLGKLAPAAPAQTYGIAPPA